MWLLTCKQNNAFDFHDNFNDICVNSAFTLLETCPDSPPKVDKSTGLVRQIELTKWKCVNYISTKLHW